MVNSFLDEDVGIKWYTCKLCGYPKEGPHAPTGTFEQIMLERGMQGRRAAMAHVEKHHPDAAKEIYAAIRQDCKAAEEQR